ncbi:hypothetical protein [Escherichia coli]|uniref:hypothetical protein n=1 Tax=Escherichia coli TaxID=562 RepID=UPI002035135F|nr:hypothetical protein [Escherichia coli]
MCKCNTVTRDDIPFAIWSGLRPDTPHQCVRAQCGFRFSSASSPTRSLTFGRWGCDHLPTEWLPVPCKWALQGAGAVPGDLKAPG